MAFNLVDHRLLLLKMQAYNFSKKTILWVSNYLSGRTSSTRIESTCSKRWELGAQGVPQGSILGSLLFVFSQSDLAGAKEGEVDH